MSSNAPPDTPANQIYDFEKMQSILSALEYLSMESRTTGSQPFHALINNTLELGTALYNILQTANSDHT